MLFIEKKENMYISKILILLERDSMGRGDVTLQIAKLFKNFITQTTRGKNRFYVLFGMKL